MNRSSLGRQKGKAFQAEVTGSRPQNPSTYAINSPGHSSLPPVQLDTVLSPSPAHPPAPNLGNFIQDTPFPLTRWGVQTEPNLFEGGLTGVEQSQPSPFFFWKLHWVQPA